MKKILHAVFFITCIATNGYGQDQIILKSAEEIKGKVTEIKIDRIVYKDFDNLEGPTIELRKGDVFMIIYENGKTYKVEEPAAASDQGKTTPGPETDPRANHIVSFFTNLPQLRTQGKEEMVGVGVGFSYEYQSKSKEFGLKLSPTCTKTDFDLNTWGLTFAVSPRWYLVNKAPGQFGLGIEASAGAFLKPDGSPSSYRSAIASGHVVFATHLYTTSKFNGNIEMGLGYEYWKQTYDYDYYYEFQKSISESNMFSFFLRISLGARLSRK